MNVGQLKALLARCDDTAAVSIEGCDCNADAECIDIIDAINGYEASVLIGRGPKEHSAHSDPWDTAIEHVEPGVASTR